MTDVGADGWVLDAVVEGDGALDAVTLGLDVFLVFIRYFLNVD